MNTSEVIQRVRRKFGDESAVQLDDSDIISWINDAQNDVVANNPNVLETEHLIDLVTEQNEYAFPEDLYVLRAVRVKETSSVSYVHLKYKTLTDFDRFVNGWDGTFFGQSFPCVYTSFNDRIYLFPPPQKTSTDGLKILYQARPTLVLTDQDELSLPLEYHTAIVRYCMAQATELDENYEASVLHQAQFNENVRTLSHRSKGANETYKTITVLPEDA